MTLPRSCVIIVGVMTSNALITASGGGDEVNSLQEKLKELRKRRGWSQEDLAREVGVSLSTIQRWERRGANPTRLPRSESSPGFFRKPESAMSEI